MGGKPRLGRRQQLKDELHPDWVVLRWNSTNARFIVPSILYAVIGDGVAVVNTAFYMQTVGWCPHGGSMHTMYTDEVEKLLALMKSGAEDSV
jgi:hypothetical protein